MNTSETSDLDTDALPAKAWPLALPFLFVGVVADQWTKSWAMTALGSGEVIQVVPGWLDFYLVRNPGAAFSFFLGSTYLFTAIAMVASVVLIVLISRCRNQIWAIALGLITAGAVGNLIDRWFRDPGPGRGHVVDFIKVHQVPFMDFPLFNIADSCITVAAVLILIQAWRGIGFDGSRDE